jgi:hypothetical protein
MKRDNKVITTKRYTIVEETLTDGTKSMQRINDGFTAFELLGMFAFINDEILMQVKGIMTPNTVRKEVVSHD